MWRHRERLWPTTWSRGGIGKLEVCAGIGLGSGSDIIGSPVHAETEVDFDTVGQRGHTDSAKSAYPTIQDL